MKRIEVAEEKAKTTVLAELAETGNWRRAVLAFLSDYSLILIFLLLFIALSFLVDHFFSVENMLGLALSVSQIGMVACTMMFCLASRDFDLSVGSTVAFSGVLCAMVLNATDNVWLAGSSAVLCGALIGFLNGFIIAYLRINALITTLATMEIVRGGWPLLPQTARLLASTMKDSSSLPALPFLACLCRFGSPLSVLSCSAYC